MKAQEIKKQIADNLSQLIERARELQGTLIPELTEDIRTIEHTLGELEGQAAVAVATEVNAAGKPVYTNETLRQAEVGRRLDLDEAVNHLRTALSTSRLNRAKFEAEETAIRRYLRFLALDMEHENRVAARV